MQKNKNKLSHPCIPRYKKNKKIFKSSKIIFNRTIFPKKAMRKLEMKDNKLILKK